MERNYEFGAHIIFVDEHGVSRNALVTAWHGESCVNLVFVTGDVKRHDSYGAQIERHSSVVYEANQPAHGMYWCWPDEWTKKE